VNNDGLVISQSSHYIHFVKSNHMARLHCDGTAQYMGRVDSEG
jgi:hypothetical protein